MTINKSFDAMFVERFKSADRQPAAGRTDGFVHSQSFAKVLEQKGQGFPYGSLAEGGIIEYNGVIFVGDAKTNTISLGDVSNPNKVLNISLPSGGNLKVNVDNLGDLSNAAGMFSPEDLNAILRAIEQYKHCTKKLGEIDEMKDELVKDDESMSAADTLKMLKEALIEQYKLTSDNIQKEDDWRKMDDEHWDKLLAHVDKNLEAFKEELEQMEEKQREAALKSAAEAPADMKAQAAAGAALDVAANGMAGESTDDDAGFLEKSSWTYDLQTDDQAILAKAKMANNFAAEMLTRLQDMALAGDITDDVSETQNVKETAAANEDENPTA